MFCLMSGATPPKKNLFKINTVIRQQHMEAVISHAHLQACSFSQEQLPSLLPCAILSLTSGKEANERLNSLTLNNHHTTATTPKTEKCHKDSH